MSIVNWTRIETLSGTELRAELFEATQAIARELHFKEKDDAEILQSVPRLAQLVETDRELGDFRPLLNALARSVGLWNYIDRSTAEVPEALVAEAATMPELGNITLHREQLSALNVLLSGRNLILSAPTSFGKSLLVDAVLASGSYQRVAIVLPTIALMDEFRRRLDARFGDDFDVLMHHAEKPTRNKVIFIGTQERLINRSDLGHLDLAIVDEFYKLDPVRSDQRSVVLNAAVYKLLAKAKQFFFLGPNIDQIRTPENSRWRFEFIKTRFSTVAVNTVDLKGVPDKDARLLEEIYTPSNWPALVFISSPDRANALAGDLAKANTVGRGDELAAWIDENYGSGWPLATVVAAGIGVHHGRVPRALASRFVKMFNDGRLPILLCTSTLIEGVNTAAKSVLIYDKKINKEEYDFFTFSNIRGRAGRLGQHHIGNVYLFHGEPDRTDVDVTPPLFGDFDVAPDELVVHIDEADLTPEIKERIEDVSERVGLSRDVVRRFAGIGFDTIAALREEIIQRDGISDRALEWGPNWPRYPQLLATCSIICRAVKQPFAEFGLASAKQLAFYLMQLSHANSIRGFYHWHASSYRGKDVSMDQVFKFLRACEFSLPELFLVVQEICKTAELAPDYSAYATSMQHWFRPEHLKVLEEQGVPMQISERFIRSGQSVSELRAILRNEALRDSDRLTEFERQWILDALPKAR